VIQGPQRQRPGIVLPVAWGAWPAESQAVVRAAAALSRTPDARPATPSAGPNPPRPWPPSSRAPTWARGSAVGSG